MNLHKYLSDIETAADLAQRLDITPVLISQWRTGLRLVPIERCFAIEQATNGLVTRKDLRPSDWHRIWPELTEQEKDKSEEAA